MVLDISAASPAAAFAASRLCRWMPSKISLDVSQLNEDAQLMVSEKIHEWLVLFTQHALPLLDEIDIARASQDNEKIKRAAHQLKSSCSSLGMRSASQQCAQLEQQPLSAPLLHEEITRSVAALEAWLIRKT